MSRWLPFAGSIFAARYYAVRPSVCHKSEFYKNGKLRIMQTTPQGNLGSFFDAKDLGEISTGSPQWGSQIEVG